ncbi:MAG: efflux RND transporter periplasmic adaptor subunit [Lautropia sp.]|nr:efflux RND transporter periplasmic adaptor subunit [Lautropia sp.]
MKAKRIVHVLIVAALLAVACLWLGGEAEPIEVMQVEADRGSITTRIRATGVVHSEHVAHLTAMVPGVVAEVKARVGDAVDAGQLLVVLDEAEARNELRVRSAAVQEARNQIGQLERRLRERRQDLAAGGGSRDAAREASDRLKNARLQLQREEAHLETARLRLQRHRIEAPIAGSVTERQANRGEFIEVGKALLTVASVTEREILVKLDPVDATAIEPGMKARVALGTAGGVTADEQVLRVDPSVKKEGTAVHLPVWVSARDTSLPLRLKQQVDVDFVTKARESALRLPPKALVNRDGKSYVWVIRQGHLALQPVETGAMGDRHVEILQGVAAGQAVVLAEGRELQEGDAARVREAP